MRAFPLLALAFLAIPLFEIFLFIQVGGVIGAWPTVGLVVLTAVVGAFLLRQQGFATLHRFQTSMQAGCLPALELLEGMALLVGGVLLLMPGFFTDAIGFLLLLPPTRRALVLWMMRHAVVVGPATGGRPQGSDKGPQVYDGECRREDDERDRLP